MTWIWLRGLGREAGHWGGLPNHAESLLNEPIITLDIPGCGRKRHQSCPLSMGPIVQELMRDVDDALVSIGNRAQAMSFQSNDAQSSSTQSRSTQSRSTQSRSTQSSEARPPSKAVAVSSSSFSSSSFKVLGLSLGGLVGLHWASVDRRVERLVVVNSSSRLSPFYHRLRPLGAMKLLSAALAMDKSRERRERRILSAVSNKPHRAKQVAPLWSEIARHRPAALTQVFRQLLLAGATSVPALDQLKHCQLTFLASRGDRLVDYRCSARLAQFYHSTLKLHDNAGHDIPLDDPEWLLTQIAALEVDCNSPLTGC
ncbi:alpha/beta fold hydrolase [Marinibactrum halimedae]|uniref:AB hydrolase-1 domain-containing protein n=1 Tax=Marinibactrum halimedae TaxID=1444977 RepID=A0AA37T692_9GAMM|nr:alpha/beta fold hydrolase [Marinibactrum halimedae]MCD9459394.1 alpha/beta fold hydrolase [Marinibactrum halimedae]GLS27539.1 hypothetical protein GCM10007877_32580 [Marinibactrum halimedae]